MKRVTKKSLDELAQTMTVIPEFEKENYWGLYGNDCFWRCVSWLKNRNITEADAAVYAYNFFNSEYDIVTAAYHLSTCNDAGVNDVQMRKFLNSNGMMVGSEANNRIIGLYHTSDLEYYRNHSEIQPYANHCIILKSVNPNGSCEMYDPQHDRHFTASKSEAAGFFPINY